MTELAKTILALPMKPIHYIIQYVLNMDNPLSESIRDFIHPNRKHRFKFVVTCLAKVLGADIRKKRSYRAQPRRVASPELRAMKRERRLAAQDISPEKLHSLQDELASLRAELGNLSLLSSMCSEAEPVPSQLQVQAAPKPATIAAPPPPPPPPPPTPPPMGFNMPLNQQPRALASQKQQLPQSSAQTILSPQSSSNLLTELKSRYAPLSPAASPPPPPPTSHPSHRQVLSPSAQIPARRCSSALATATPTSIVEALKMGSSSRLKSTNVQRSPGGTPMKSKQGSVMLGGIDVASHVLSFRKGRADSPQSASSGSDWDSKENTPAASPAAGRA